MNDFPNLFRGDASTLELAKFNVNEILSEAKFPCCDKYHTIFGKAEKQAEAFGDAQRAAICAFLRDICSFRLRVDTPAEPFVPLMQFENGKRTSIPADLSPLDLDIVRGLTQKTADPALCARLFDVLWVCQKDHKCGIQASKEYVATAQALFNVGQAIRSTEHFHRGVQLAAKFGRKNEAFEHAASALVEATREASKESASYNCCQLMQIMFDLEIGDPEEFAAIASGIADADGPTANVLLARAYRECEADWHKRNSNTEAEKKARLAAAETYVADAENRTKGKNASFMAAASMLSQGIEALRRAGESKKRIKKLRKKLNDYAAESLKEFSTFEHTIDLTDQARNAREHVKADSFHIAALKLAFGHPLTDVAKLKKAVIKSANDFPMQYLMQRVEVDRAGRVQYVRGSALDSDTEEACRALDDDMFDHAMRFHWSIRSTAYIEPARIQVLNDWLPTFLDIAPIVFNNPFVPPGHEAIFLRGIHAGFHGDFVVASHLLVPQIENSLRYVLESNGVDVSNLMGDGTQPLKILGAIFDKSETKETFGEEFCFELRGCLIQKTGYDFRNRIAHGFVSTADCQSHAARMAWWLVLRLCLTPAYHQQMQLSRKRRAKSKYQGKSGTRRKKS